MTFATLPIALLGSPLRTFIFARLPQPRSGACRTFDAFSLPRIGYDAWTTRYSGGPSCSATPSRLYLNGEIENPRLTYAQKLLRESGHSDQELKFHSIAYADRHTAS